MPSINTKHTCFHVVHIASNFHSDLQCTLFVPGAVVCGTFGVRSIEVTHTFTSGLLFAFSDCPNIIWCDDLIREMSL